MLSGDIQGRIQDFKVGGGAHLKKLRRAEGDANIFGVFRVKNNNFTQKINIFSNFRGGARRIRPPPLNPPLIYQPYITNNMIVRLRHRKDY